jgi:hypothetical protein
MGIKIVNTRSCGDDWGLTQEQGTTLRQHGLLQQPQKNPLTDNHLGVGCGQKWLKVVFYGSIKG